MRFASSERAGIKEVYLIASKDNGYRDTHRLQHLVLMPIDATLRRAMLDEFHYSFLPDKPDDHMLQRISEEKAAFENTIDRWRIEDTRPLVIGYGPVFYKAVDLQAIAGLFFITMIRHGYWTKADINFKKCTGK